MREEPAIDRAALCAAVREAYGFTPESLSFVPVGYAAACYVVRVATGERYFLKLWPDTEAGRRAASRRHVVLPLLRAIYERGLPLRVPFPVPTRDGALWATFEGAPYAISPFLRGRTPPGWPRWPAERFIQLAQTMAAMHAATATLVDVLPPREEFSVPFEERLLDCLAALEHTGSEARPGVLALREFLLPRQDEVLQQLGKLRGLQAVVRHLEGPFVLCHNDFGGDNVLFDPAGELAILDWDDASLAPPEHDLGSVLGPCPAEALAAYWACGGARTLHPERFAFAQLRRSMHDVTARLHRILYEPPSEEQAHIAIQEIQQFGFAEWRTVDASTHRFAGVLNSANLL